MCFHKSEAWRSPVTRVFLPPDLGADRNSNMLSEERGFFLEIADIIRGMGLTILKGVMETRRDKIWARFAVEANRDVTRMERSSVSLCKHMEVLRARPQLALAMTNTLPFGSGDSNSSRGSFAYHLFEKLPQWRRIEEKCYCCGLFVSCAFVDVLMACFLIKESIMKVDFQRRIKINHIEQIWRLSQLICWPFWAVTAVLQPITSWTFSDQREEIWLNSFHEFNLTDGIEHKKPLSLGHG